MLGLYCPRPTKIFKKWKELQKLGLPLGFRRPGNCRIHCSLQSAGPRKFMMDLLSKKRCQMEVC
eukprot:3484012-Amphidinium_carterae.1